MSAEKFRKKDSLLKRSRRISDKAFDNLKPAINAGGFISKQDIKEAIKKAEEEVGYVGGIVEGPYFSALRRSDEKSMMALSDSTLILINEELENPKNSKSRMEILRIARVSVMRLTRPFERDLLG